MEGHVYKRGSTWTYVVNLPPDPLTGKRKQKSKGGFKTEEEAELAKLEKILEIKKGLYKPDSQMTVEQYLEFWLENYSKVKHRLTTYITNRELVRKRMIPVLGKIKLNSLSADKIETFLTELKKKGYSDSYIHGIFRVLRRAMRMAHFKWELIPTDIMKKVDPPRVTKKERLTWTLEQCQTFLKAASESRFYTAYLTAINTGMRRGEVLGIQESDFSYERTYIEVSQSLTYHTEFGFIIQEPKTKKSERRTPIIDRLILETLKEKIEQNHTNAQKNEAYQKQWGLINCHSDGEPIRPAQLRHDYDKIIKKSGLPYIRFHDLRHSFATNLWELGFDLKDIQEILGHSSVAITGDIYTHMREEKKKNLMAKYSEAINSSKEDLVPVDN
ncbi:tyrosine-type recombinase/integrase [Paenibacillus sp. chi10]|uniref:Tyrosine-type recombinase/integrase n=1 Tax=Paenibacillus suaedae TaxID=3077233 RepID=A0AAJ2K132_9BACL|nr:tyrosine-type recombinase/integrase [Paenibacillus sp. chi10]MDT8980027.1 tyrosine-type recombinase/integrase [Paenibacillus sp. chi10]